MALLAKQGPDSSPFKGWIAGHDFDRERRRSGQPFSTPVAYFERSGGWLVVGSAGGMPQEPQWFKNLRAAESAFVEFGDQRLEVAVRVLVGAERDEAFAHVLSENPGFADYERKAERPMPVALLTPR